MTILCIYIIKLRGEMLIFFVYRIYMVGRRIVDVFYIFQQLQNSVHYIAFGYSFMNSELVKEIRNGYF